MVKQRGIEHLFLFSVDNPLVRIADPMFIGYCAERRVEMGFKVVRRRSPAEPTGIVHAVVHTPDAERREHDDGTCRVTGLDSEPDTSDCDKVRNNAGGGSDGSINIGDGEYSSAYDYTIYHQLPPNIAAARRPGSKDGRLLFDLADVFNLYFSVPFFRRVALPPSSCATAPVSLHVR